MSDHFTDIFELGYASLVGSGAQDPPHPELAQACSSEEVSAPMFPTRKSEDVSVLHTQEDCRFDSTDTMAWAEWITVNDEIMPEIASSISPKTLSSPLWILPPSREDWRPPIPASRVCGEQVTVRVMRSAGRRRGKECLHRP